MSKIIVTRGLPASGKSTWAKSWVAADPANRVRVNRDAIRWTQGIRTGVGTHEQEQLVTLIEEGIVKAAVAKKKDVVVDATHLRASFAARWYKFGAEVEFMDFAVPVETCVDRDWNRYMADERNVGAKVIRDMAQRFGIKADGALPAWPRNTGALVERFKPYVKGPVKAYSFDIDGTLLQMNGKRGPYDTSLYHLDDADPNMYALYCDLWDIASISEPRTAFIGLSGRNEDHREETVKSLEGWGIFLDAIYMRPSDNPQGNDADVKSELVDKYISGVYDVIMHFDDRNRVVDALRAKGMKVAQVQPGDF